MIFLVNTSTVFQNFGIPKPGGGTREGGTRGGGAQGKHPSRSHSIFIRHPAKGHDKKSVYAKEEGHRKLGLQEKNRGKRCGEKCEKLRKLQKL